MIEVLYSGYIADEVNETGPQDINCAQKFSGATTVSFILIAHHGKSSPNTSGVKAEIAHSDDGNVFVPVPNAVLMFSDPGQIVTSIVEVEAGTLKTYAKIVLAGTGTGDPAGAGSVVAVW